MIWRMPYSILCLWINLVIAGESRKAAGEAGTDVHKTPIADTAPVMTWVAASINIMFPLVTE